jgi:hypothetical protein
VQTADLDNSVAWYSAFFGGSVRWELDRFSDLTRARLPGIVRLVEVGVGDLRFHLFSRPGADLAAAPEALQFQHVCVRVEARGMLDTLRERWCRLRASGTYAFTVDEAPTDIVVDGDGVASFYARDVNGLEFEFTHLPDGD